MGKQLHNEMAMLQAAAEKEAKALRDDITTLTTARAAAEEQAKTLRSDINTVRAATKEQAKTLRDNITTLTTARAAAKEQVKTLRADINTARAAAKAAQTQADNMASNMDMEEERHNKEANEQDKTIEKLQKQVKALEDV